MEITTSQDYFLTGAQQLRGWRLEMRPSLRASGASSRIGRGDRAITIPTLLVIVLRITLLLPTFTRLVPSSHVSSDVNVSGANGVQSTFRILRLRF